LEAGMSGAGEAVAERAVVAEVVAMERVRAQLHERYARAVEPQEVDRAVEGARCSFAGCRVRAFVPILVEREVRSRLDPRLKSGSGART
jgi:hypothetical protein